MRAIHPNFPPPSQTEAILGGRVSPIVAAVAGFVLGNVAARGTRETQSSRWLAKMRAASQKQTTTQPRATVSIDDVRRRQREV